ncbi:phosphate-selective porin O and P [Flavobacterium enshiense DK69]|uniref:Porin n=1 Tax=Flavobacterium enshiense DK69 TaxID=1107311 RepID=V6S149_9FLAO|nr:porin [Flavobacterium enshiense]ESU20398.1 phosphate-selective porin O and P [Flavobacterium enshiense DK69]KGO95795.1 porin [Flavobacterium enshiense DK69]
MKKFLLQSLLLLSLMASAQEPTVETKTEVPPQEVAPKKEEKKWYDKISLRGYAQVRYNKLLETNPDLGCEQCDRSWGGKNSFFLRRARLVFSGDVHERLYIYIQPDFASDASPTGKHFFQIRDAYFDLNLDKDKEYRIRVGQSKIPFGFENLQSSQNRLALDRADALNSAVANERDLGIFFYWATKEKRQLFKKLVDDGLKGSGDYGVFGVGMFNGQTANRPEANTSQHIVARFTYPVVLDNGQIFETGIQAYNGKYVVNTLTTGTNAPLIENGNPEFTDQRAAVHFVWYPKPFGFQGEANIGKGPQYNPVNNTIEEKQLEGAYGQITYNAKIKNHVLFPFVKYHWYEGGKKHELDARSYKVNDLEIGVEWQPFKNFEFVADYTISDRIYEDAAKRDNHQKGSLLRLQAQFNF